MTPKYIRSNILKFCCDIVDINHELWDAAVLGKKNHLACDSQSR